ncbi:MAG: HYR domain-containing protein [Phycisphaerae bacterium]|nr:HYR domain-containing protein [Phycisphaerae bacterium]
MRPADGSSLGTTCSVRRRAFEAAGRRDGALRTRLCRGYGGVCDTVLIRRIGADEVNLGAGYTLDVAADPETNRLISVNDGGGAVNVNTPFSQLYPDGSIISLTVQVYDETFFVRWTLDGLPQPLHERTLQVTMDQPHTAVAYFVAGGTILVAQDGSGDFTTIQAAIDAAAAGNVIVVRTGDYHERISLLGKAITVQSLVPEDPDVVSATIVDGDAGGSVVTCSTGESVDTVISGLTITNGRTNYGGGFYCWTNINTQTSPTIEFCDIRDNLAISNGGAIHLQFGSPILYRNLIRNNRAFGSGGGFYAQNISGQTPYNPTLEGNRFLSNTAGGNGGGIYLESSCRAVLRSNVVADNQASDSGGIFTSGSLTTINYCTIANNGSYGVRCYTGTTKISNSIIYGNVDDVYLHYGTLTITYSDIGEGYAGEGNISVDPSFADPGAGVYNLQSGSPCIDAGSPLALVLPAERDVDGDERVAGARIDMGADETSFVADAYVLWVTSTPASGVAIDYTPLDVNSLPPPGNTPFFRSYLASTPATVVTLTAPGMSSAGAFRRWVLDGAPQPAGQADLLVLMNGPHSARAEYLAPLTVSANVPAVPITVTPADANGDSDGNTEFTRYYDLDTVVTLTAPDPAPTGEAWIGWQLDGTAPPAFQRTYYEGLTVTLTAPQTSCVSTFQHWEVDGVAQTASLRDLVVFIDADYAVTAVYSDSGPDCNTNGVGDLCDIGMGTSTDCNNNQIPDECEPDCNGNGIPDAWDISSGGRANCNGNQIPDDCDIAAGTSANVNGNGTITVVAEPPSGTLFEIGTTTVTLRATDIVGNTATCTFDVIVIAPEEAPKPEPEPEPEPEETEPEVNREELQTMVSFFWGVPLCPLTAISLMVVSLIGMTASRRRTRPRR